ncbi:MAG: tetratricopeptide repeat protein [Myxococcota bacterium]
MLARILHNNLRQAIAQRESEAVRALLEQLASVDPDSVYTRCLELEWLIVSSRLDEAQRVAKTVVERFSTSARAHWLAGWAAYRGRRWRDALSAFEESERIHSSASVRRWIGRTLSQLGDFERAEPILRSLGPKGWLDLSWLCERRGEHAEALALVERHLENHPDDAWARDRRERLIALTMDDHEVLEEMEVLEELGESMPRALAEQAFRKLLEMGRGEEARDLMERQLGAAPSGEITSWAWIAYRAEELDVACRLFARTFSRNCDNAKFLSAYERAAKAAGRLDELLELYGVHAPQHRRLYGRAKRLRKSGR